MTRFVKPVCLPPAFTALFMAALFIASGQSAARPMGFDSAKAIRKLGVQNENYTAALRRGDSIALGNLYTADAKIFNHASPTTVGRAAIVHFYGGMIRAGVTGFRYHTVGLWRGGNDLVVEEGTLVFSFVNGEPVAKGRYPLVWKREGNEWKIFRDSFSSGE